MTFIAEGGSRTVSNGCVWGTRKVYEIVTSSVLDVVQCVPFTGEVEKTGEKVTEPMTFHVIAISEDLARALFNEHYGASQRHTLVSIKPLFVIDGEIETGRK